jgi:DNA-binding protein H-NS
MARKPMNNAPKKMGRPKGSTNKKTAHNDSSLLSSFGKLAFGAQEALLGQMASMYESAKHSRAAELMAELSKLGISTEKKRGRPTGSTNGKSKRGLAGVKVQARYRSKEDPSLTWAGRGMTPKWMKAEMRGTKLSKEDFAI